MYYFLEMTRETDDQGSKGAVIHCTSTVQYNCLDILAYQVLISRNQGTRIKQGHTHTHTHTLIKRRNEKNAHFAIMPFHKRQNLIIKNVVERLFAVVVKSPNNGRVLSLQDLSKLMAR